MPRSKKPENRRLIREWASAAMALLIGQGQRPIRCGRRGDSLVWRDERGPHTFVINWYDEPARCVRIHIDHYRVLASRKISKLMHCGEFVEADRRGQVEITVLPEEMPTVLVWALDRQQPAPCVWWACSSQYYFSDDANTVLRATLGKPKTRWYFDTRPAVVPVDGALPTHVGGLGELVAAAKAELEKLG